MKHLKMVGLVVVAALALSAFAGAGAASATVLCKEDKNPCGSDYSSGTEIKGQLPLGVTNLWRKGGKVVDTCWGATLLGFTSNTGGFSSSVILPLKSLTWSECTTTREVIKPGTFEISYTGASETVGTLKLKEIQFKESGCTYGLGSSFVHVGRMKKSATALSPATFEIDMTFGPISGFPCFESVELESFYSLTAPVPLYVSTS